MTEKNLIGFFLFCVANDGDDSEAEKKRCKQSSDEISRSSRLWQKKNVNRKIEKIQVVVVRAVN
jgi:hypothetical protein